MKLLLAIVSMVIGTGATLVSLVLCMASGANSSEAEIRAIKAIMIGMGLCWGACIAGGIWALATGRPVGRLRSGACRWWWRECY